MGQAAYEYPKLAIQDYFHLERMAGPRHEYFRGDVYLMAGGSAPHSRVIGNVTGSLFNTLEPTGCYAAPSDQKVWVKEADLVAYPDVVIVCENADFDETQPEALLEPSVLVEVLSPSTEKYDQTTKLAAYKQISTLTDYLIISQEHIRVHQHTRQADGSWTCTHNTRRSAVIQLESLGIELPLEHIYRGLDLPESPLELVP